MLPSPYGEPSEAKSEKRHRGRFGDRLTKGVAVKGYVRDVPASRREDIKEIISVGNCQSEGNNPARFIFLK